MVKRRLHALSHAHVLGAHVLTRLVARLTPVCNSCLHKELSDVEYLSDHRAPERKFIWLADQSAEHVTARTMLAEAQRDAILRGQCPRKIRARLLPANCRLTLMPGGLAAGGDIADAALR